MAAMERNPTLACPIGGNAVVTAFDVVTSASELAAALAFLHECSEPMGVDVETTGLNPRRDRLRLVSVATSTGVIVVDVDRVRPEDFLVVLHEKHLVFHNAAFDLSFLRRFVPEFGKTVFDTMLASQVLDAGHPPEKGFHSLVRVCERHLGVDLDKTLQVSDWSGALSGEQLRYAALDAAVLLPLRERLLEELLEADLSETMELESRCLPGVVAMSAAGVPFDEWRWIHRVSEDDRDSVRALKHLETVALEHGGSGINWNSGPQIKEFFLRRGLTLPDTQRDTLSRLTDPVATALVAYKESASAVSRYGADFAEVVDGRIFPSWHQIGAASGRMSCSSPNLQALPRDKRYRSCIRAKEGYALVATDLSQIELRIAAKISGDQRLRSVFQNRQDLHTITAQSILGLKEVTKEQRQLAKALNFGLLYGMGPATLQTYARVDYGINLTERQAAAYRETFFLTYPGLRRWHREVVRGWNTETRTLGGRRRLLSDRTSFTQILNTPVQGTGADGIKAAIALLSERRKACPEGSLVLAVHDELVVEVPTEKVAAARAWLEAAMTDGMAPLIAPVPVEVETTVEFTEAE